MELEPINISRLHDLPPDYLSELATESEVNGQAFIRRLIAEWESGDNRFSRPGEALFVAKMGGRIVGICGLNVDPYQDSKTIGRVRRLYVLRKFRRRGIGGQLVHEVIRAASGVFRELRLRTHSTEASAFYLAIGFHACAGIEDTTHRMAIKESAEAP